MPNMFHKFFQAASPTVPSHLVETDPSEKFGVSELFNKDKVSTVFLSIMVLVQDYMWRDATEAPLSQLAYGLGPDPANLLPKLLSTCVPDSCKDK